MLVLALAGRWEREGEAGFSRPHARGQMVQLGLLDGDGSGRWGVMRVSFRLHPTRFKVKRKHPE